MSQPAEDFCLVYVTARDRAEAADLARHVVGRRLAACANILGEIRSVYWWEGAVRDDAECALILKTTKALFSRLEAEIRARHGYDCPCIVAMPFCAGSAPFLDWIADQTSGA